MMSARIKVTDALDAIEYIYEHHMTDGLPVIPPTEARVGEFLDCVGLQPSHVVGVVTERARAITAEKLAINAVMAGCLPTYMPVLVAAVEALCDPAFRFNHLASTGSPWPLLVVSGPAVRELSMNHGMFLFGSANRANATLGRAISLLLWNCCEVRPDAIQRGHLGTPQRFSFCIAENPDTAWEGLNEWEGYDRQTSAVTISSSEPYCLVRTEATTPRGILAPIVNGIAKHTFWPGCYVVVIPPNIEKHLVEQGWTKRRIRDHIFENCRRTIKDLKEDARWGRNTSAFEGDLSDLVPVEPEDDKRWVYLFKKNPGLDRAVFHEACLDRRQDILVVAAGGDAGFCVGIVPPYGVSTNPVTRPVKTPREQRG
ncbi:MAG: hypothetical protein HY684_03725 [Chloroflexi bacterium]|nr:hypothetical protein [Chloroflexota bacterium]